MRTDIILPLGIFYDITTIFCAYWSCLNSLGFTIRLRKSHLKRGLNP